MAYKFVDTIEEPGAEEMPAEAMKINGEYIENQMDSRYCTYRTLYVKGREMLSPELSSFETGVRDGSSLLSRRYPARVITIGYKLQAESNYWFRVAYNELNKILNVENVEIIFYDEQDKYFIGTPSGVEEDVEPGTNFVQGEFNIYCADPFKYSVKEYEVEPTEDEGSTFVIDYEGTYNAHPILEADFYQEDSFGEDGDTETALTGSGDCGYVAWYKPGEEEYEESQIIQLGDPDEGDIEEYEKSQTLMTQKWYSVTSWTNALNAYWTQNVGDVTSGTKWIRGSTGFVLSDFDKNYNFLTATSYGSSSDTGEHGPTATYTIPADASGVVGAVDWTLKYDLKCCIANDSTASSCMGMFEATVSDDSGKIIAGMSVFKESAGTSANLRAYINNNTVKTISIDLSYRNSHFGTNKSDGSFKSVKACSIVKSGDTVTMNLGGTTWSFTNSSIKNLVATKVTFFFGTYRAKTPLYWNGIYSCSFTKNNCETWQDIPNKFGANDIAIADCTDGTVYLNNSPYPEYGALGNNWEGFCLTPGYNQIGFSYSDWCKNPPTSKITYREVFL